MSLTSLQTTLILKTEEYLKNIFHCPAIDKNGHETGVTCASCKRCFSVKNGDKTAVYKH